MKRNIVLLCLDTVRKDFFDRYARRLQELADIRFDNWRAPSCATVPSHLTMLTGRYPYEEPTRTFHSLESSDTFLGVFDKNQTVAISMAGVLDPGSGFASLFDEYLAIKPNRRFPEALDTQPYESEDWWLRSYFHFLLDALRHDMPLKSLWNGLAAQLNNRLEAVPLPMPVDGGTSSQTTQIRRKCYQTPEPFFLYANYMEAHEPLRDFIGYKKEIVNPPRGWSSSAFDVSELKNGRGGPNRVKKHHSYLTIYRGLYAAAIDYLDRQLAPLVSDIQRGTDLETTIIITADHGEALGFEEDGFDLGHWNTFAESVLHVPFLVVNPPTQAREKKTGFHSHRGLRKLIPAIAIDAWEDISEGMVGAEFICKIDDPDIPKEERSLVNRTLRCAYRRNEKVVWDSRGTWYRHRLTDQPVPSEPEPIGEVVPDWATSQFSTEIGALNQR